MLGAHCILFLSLEEKEREILARTLHAPARATASAPFFPRKHEKPRDEFIEKEKA